MKSARTLAVFLVTLAGLAGCRHKEPAVPPPTATAPPINPAKMAQTPALPAVPPATAPAVRPPGSDQNTEKAAAPPPPPHHVRRRRHPSADAEPTPGTTAAAPAAAPPAATPASPAPAAAPQQPSLGQLSAGSAVDGRELAAMNDQIKEQEARLGAIKHPLSSDAQAIALQVKVFLDKARQALAESDLDGARTLTTKAKVLLDELSSS